MSKSRVKNQYASRGLLSRDWVVFAIASALVVSLVLETSIIRISGFQNVRDIHSDVEIFSALEIFCVISQFIILNFAHNKVSKSLLLHNKPRIHILHKAIVIIQLGIIALLLVILFEVSLSLSYDLILLKAVVLGSFLTAACMMGLLSSRFIIWMRSNKNRLTLAYLLASSCLSVSAIMGAVYVLDQLSYAPYIVHPKPYSDFITHVQKGDSSLAYIYTISSAITFILLWIGTVFLLQSYRKRFGTIRYWIIMSIPLLYFLSQFQPLVLNVLLNYSSENPMLFSIVYVIMVDASRPVGGVLFGLAFIQVSRKIENPEVKSYIVMSGIGLLLLLVSYQAQVLITAPFPPFGLLSTSFMGLSSYLIFVGIYSSAVSISQDSKLRASIRKSIETEVEFIGNIGNAQLDHTIVEKVLKTTRNISETMPQETGIATSLTENEITEYIQQVLVETRIKKVR